MEARERQTVSINARRAIDAPARRQAFARGVAWIVPVLVTASLLAAGTAAAERAWVKGEVRLNIRSGAGTQFRILGGVATGDGLDVIQRSEKWTKVRLDDGKQGWMPVGYLQAEPPASIKLESLESEVMDLRTQLKKVSSERSELLQDRDQLKTYDEGQKSDIERLTMENMELRAGARWPEWITGASVLAAGMALGALLHRSSGRRAQPRIRL